MDPRKTSGPTLLVLVLLCALGLFFGVRTLTGGLPDDPIVKDPEPTCVDRPIAADTKVFPADVMVSVYNGGGRSGVASRTMGELIDRGFVAGDTGNVSDADVKFVQVWADDPDSPAVQLVARQFGNRTKVVTDRPTLGLGVVVVVGEEFQRFGPTVPSVTARADAVICSPPI
jgi:hypothetical protein